MEISSSMHHLFDSICTIDAEGNNLKNLTNWNSRDLRPRWSNDGQILYFQSNRSGKYQIYRMIKDGLDIQQVFQSDSHQTNPSELKKVNKLIYANHTDEHVNIHILNMDDLSIEFVFQKYE